MTLGQRSMATAREAVEIIERASGIEDPYLRADGIWEAVECLDGYGGAHSDFFTQVARDLEEECDGSRLPARGSELRRHARLLESHVDTQLGLLSSGGALRAAHQPALAGIHAAI